jgi:hypothetical protein
MNPISQLPAWLRTHPRCGAKTRRATPCVQPAMPNGRCRFHGGLSTGPRTPEGLERSRRARWVHGRRSREVREQRAQAHRAWRDLLAFLAQDVPSEKG